MIPLNEAEAVGRLWRGDQSAFEDLYAVYAEPAIRTAYLITRSQGLAEDAVQEAFVQIVVNAAKTNEDRSRRGELPEIVAYTNRLKVWVSDQDDQITEVSISGEFPKEVLVKVAESLFTD